MTAEHGRHAQQGEIMIEVFVIVVADCLGDEVFGLPEVISVERDADVAWDKAARLAKEYGPGRMVGCLTGEIVDEDQS